MTQRSPEDAARLAEIDRELVKASQHLFWAVPWRATVLLLRRLLREAEAERDRLEQEVESLTATHSQAIYDRDCAWKHIRETQADCDRAVAEARREAIDHACERIKTFAFGAEGNGYVQRAEAARDVIRMLRTAEEIFGAEPRRAMIEAAESAPHPTTTEPDKN